MMRNEKTSAARKGKVGKATNTARVTVRPLPLKIPTIHLMPHSRQEATYDEVDLKERRAAGALGWVWALWRTACIAQVVHAVVHQLK